MNAKIACLLAGSLTLAACASDINLSQPSAPMDVVTARALLRDMPDHVNICAGGLSDMYRIEHVLVGDKAITINRTRYPYADMKSIVFSPSSTTSMSTPVTVTIRPGAELVTGFNKKNNAYGQRIADALLTLRNADTPEARARADAAFALVAAQYRQADPKPALTEDMRRAEVQAEGAVRDKDFASADSLYENALQAAPWWPQGHFNRALILESEEDYAGAVTEMKRYLLLAPDAPNARAAQDKIYEWERKATQP